MIGDSVASGEIVSRDEDDASRGEARVSIPLKVGDRTIGAIVLFELLAQKASFSALDHELFSLLAGHAATAMLAAQLHGQSERKLNTMQGLLELLTR
jgi:transcriptional regulator with GAF, ATPase, and Fis domain